MEKYYIIFGYAVVIWYDRSLRLWTASCDKPNNHFTEYHVDRDILLIIVGNMLRVDDEY